MKKFTSYICDTVLNNEFYYISPITPELLEQFRPVDKAIYELNPVRAYLLFPLLVHQEAIGTIVFSNTEVPFDLTEAQIHTIEHYVTQIDTAINNAFQIQQSTTNVRTVIICTANPDNKPLLSLTLTLVATSTKQDQLFLFVTQNPTIHH